MAQGKALSDVQEEKLRHAFLAGDDVVMASRLAECSLSSAKTRYRRLEVAPPDNLDQLRLEKSHAAVETAVREMTEVRLTLIRSIPGKVADAPLRDVTVAIGILTDKVQLLTGAATANVAHSGTINHRDLSRFTDGEVEAMSAVAERAKAERMAVGV